MSSKPKSEYMFEAVFLSAITRGYSTALASIRGRPYLPERMLCNRHHHLVFLNHRCSEYAHDNAPIVGWQARLVRTRPLLLCAPRITLVLVDAQRRNQPSAQSS